MVIANTHLWFAAALAAAPAAAPTTQPTMQPTAPPTTTASEPQATSEPAKPEAKENSESGEKAGTRGDGAEKTATTATAAPPPDSPNACTVALDPDAQAAYDRLKELERDLAREMVVQKIHKVNVQEAVRRLAAVQSGASTADKDLLTKAEAALDTVETRIKLLQAKMKAEQDKIDAKAEAPRKPRNKDPKGFSLSERMQLRRCIRGVKNARIEALIERETRSFRGALLGARASRCATALCWGPAYKFAFEPLAELPIGKSFAVPSSGLARYVNGNDVQVSFNAGFRFWLAWDWVSFAVYLSKPLLQGGDFIHVSGSSHEFATSQVRRPLPGLGVGLFGDLLWLSFDYDQLRNGNSSNLRAPEFPQNAIVSHAFTFTIAIAPLAGLRNGLGTLGEKKRREENEAAQQALAEKQRQEQKERDEQLAAEAKEQAAVDMEPSPAPTAAAEGSTGG